MLLCRSNTTCAITGRAWSFRSRSHAISRAAVDPARVAAAALPGGAQGWRYWRWHGSPRMYYSDYPDAALANLAAHVVQHPGQAQAPWVIFDNTAHAFASANAARLQELLARRSR